MQEDFLDFIQEHVEENGFKLKLNKSEYLRCDGVLTRGYFCDQEKVLAVAVKNKNYLPILVHEYAHFTQYVDNCIPWRNMIKYGSIEKFWAYLGGDNSLSKEEVIPHLKRVIRVEMDAEKRSVKFIKQFDLDIDIEDYIQKSNAYGLSYHRMLEKRKWFAKKEAAYVKKGVVKNMPKKFLSSYDKLPSHLEEIFIRNGL